MSHPHSASHPHIKNNVIRIELSPSKEHVEGFSIDDWARRCARYAARKHGIERKSGLRR